MPVANLYHQRAQGTSRSGVRRSVAALQLCLLGLLCILWAAVFEGTETLAVFLASLFTLLEAPEAPFATLHFLICFDTMDML